MSKLGSVIRGLQSIEDRICASDPYRWTHGTIYNQAIRLIKRLHAQRNIAVDRARLWEIRATTLEKTLVSVKEKLQTWPIDDHEHCMCGSLVSGHSIGSGHSPVTQGDHAISLIIEEINSVIK